MFQITLSIDGTQYQIDEEPDLYIDDTTAKVMDLCIEKGDFLL